jgi:hypothetical protein
MKVHIRLILAGVLISVVMCVAMRGQTSSPAPKGDPVTGTIEGKVVNESGQPLAGALLSIRAVNSTMSGRTTTSDTDGNFRVNGLEPALYVISANIAAYTNLPSDPLAPTYYRIGDSARVELIRGGVITGTVTNGVGEPLIAVRVRATMIRDANGKAPKSPWFGFLEQPTDDRGIYRIFGLAPGTYLVSAGASGFATSFSPYDTDVPTFAPSSTRDTAAEVNVKSGEESTIDIRYRGEPGHSISGTVKLQGTTNASITLTPAGAAQPIANSFQMPSMRGFVFNGVSDGEYDLFAQETVSAPGSPTVMFAYSQSKRITVKGADVSGVELMTRPLGSISGEILLEPSKVPECQGKRPPLLAETLVRFQRPDKEVETDDLVAMRSSFISGSPDSSGVFTLRNLVPGRYQLEPKFYARYWYLRSITMNSAGPKAQKIDVAANWAVLKPGEPLSNLTITLAQGAATLHGAVPVAEGAALPAGMVVYLVPNDPDKLEDVLRYFVTSIDTDGKFTFSNLPPGRYLALTQTNVDAQIATLAKLRQPEAASARAKLRRTAETKKTEIELKPCQNLNEYQLKQ